MRRVGLSVDRGFTLIEIIVTVGIFVFISSIGLFFSMGGYRSGAFYSDRNLLVALLQHARAQSMNNMCVGVHCDDGKSHGVAIIGNSYVIFQGSSYVARDVDADVTFDSNPSISRTGLLEIVFSQLSGLAIPGDIVLFDVAGHISTTSIYANGRIVWTH